jgi:glutathione S-transferase
MSQAMHLKLRTAPASPFGRKVRIVAIETGLIDRIAIVGTDPADTTSGLERENPLSKIPTLVLPDGRALFDSRVIAEYLDAQHDGPKLHPASGEARWRALRHQAVGDGMMDAAVLRRGFSLLPEGTAPERMEARQRAAVARALDLLEAEVPDLSGDLTIGRIAVACALGYLDLRFAAEDWRGGHPALAEWHRAFAARPSYSETAAG